MFERFTDRARRVVVLAQEHARLLNNNYIGTEHVLLGLLHEDEGVAARALKELGLNLDKLREYVEEIVLNTNSDATLPGHIPFTPRAKKVLEMSLREALQLGHNYIGTEHILLGLIREGEGVAAQSLEHFDITLSGCREKVIEILSGDVSKKQAARVEQPDRTLSPGDQMLRETILHTTKKLVDDFLYYDRKEDDRLPRGVIDSAITRGIITPAEILEAFAQEAGWQQK